ncbi:hypothetical protein DITRI_Ditri07aG0117600 [Diplodiscus trichospermus]
MRQPHTVLDTRSLIHICSRRRPTHGFSPSQHYPKCSWNHRECYLTLPVLVSSANFCSNLQERVSGAVLPGPIPSNLNQLHGLGHLRTADGAPKQHPGCDHQWHRDGHRVPHTTKRRSMVVGIIAILFNIMMYAAPLSVMKLVITTKSVEYMPFFLSLASLANGVAWTTYAFLPFDPFIAVPNGLGTLFSLAQLLLYATYYKSTKRIIAARQETKIEMHLSEVVVNGGGVDPKKTGSSP